MKILITGSNGFVGQNLTSELKKNKHTIIEFDISNGQDILKQKHLQKALNGADIVIHLAAIIENENPLLWKVNVLGTKLLMEEAIKARVKKIIFLSSTGVYGFTKKPVSEKSKLKPITIYEKSKAEAEKIVLSHQEEISVNIIRSAMIFGPNKYWEKMIRVLQKDLPLPGSGKNTYQIIYVKELARAINLLINKGDSGEIFLVAGKEKWSLKKFCEEIKKSLGLKGKIKTMPVFLTLILGKIFRIKILTKENIRHLSKERDYNTTKIEKLGYKQKHALKEAINETINEIK